MPFRDELERERLSDDIVFYSGLFKEGSIFDDVEHLEYLKKKFQRLSQKHHGRLNEARTLALKQLLKDMEAERKQISEDEAINKLRKDNAAKRIAQYEKRREEIIRAKLEALRSSSTESHMENTENYASGNPTDSDHETTEHTDLNNSNTDDSHNGHIEEHSAEIPMDSDHENTVHTESDDFHTEHIEEHSIEIPLDSDHENTEIFDNSYTEETKSYASGKPMEFEHESTEYTESDNPQNTDDVHTEDTEDYATENPMESDHESTEHSESMIYGDSDSSYSTSESSETITKTSADNEDEDAALQLSFAKAPQPNSRAETPNSFGESQEKFKAKAITQRIIRSFKSNKQLENEAEQEAEKQVKIFEEMMSGKNGGNQNKVGNVPQNKETESNDLQNFEVNVSEPEVPKAGSGGMKKFNALKRNMGLKEN
jgi:hypothetical protein